MLIFISVFAAMAQENTISIAWSPNTEPDLYGYRVHYGTRSRSYHISREVGNVTEYTLKELNPDSTYFIALTALDVWGNESIYSKEVSAIPKGGDTPIGPSRYSLASAFPNPLRAGETTFLSYDLPEAREQISLSVFNALGQRVRTIFYGSSSAGAHMQAWDGRDDNGELLAAGIYYIRFQTGIKILVTPLTIFH